MDKLHKTKRGRKAKPERVAALERWGCGPRAFDRWNRIAVEVGEPAPWSGTVAEMIAWARRHGRNVPTWMTNAPNAAAAQVAENSPPPSRPPVTGDALPLWQSAPQSPETKGNDDLVAVLGSLIADVRQKIENGRAQNADPAQLAAWGKDYTNLLALRNKSIAELRQKDDGLVPRDRVIAFVDTIHAAIPNRVETALLNAKQEAAAALAADRWPEFCETFRLQHLAEVARQSFGIELPAA